MYILYTFHVYLTYISCMYDSDVGGRGQISGLHPLITTNMTTNMLLRGHHTLDFMRVQPLEPQGMPCG